MADFERTNLREVREQVASGVGFVVAGHNYGRVDRMDEDELTTVARSAGKLLEEAARLLDAIDYETYRRGEQSKQ